ncbi:MULTISPECIES: hypothetical protein [unclassified Bacillus (in: firmicutes)]|uniref:hypothetical protein n=1 Tax=unclassified Bacillus (in: firmicutes) TaxID=185979 RepID=UPI001BE684C9|nr:MULTISPECIES: hypothetical protein [unclassified Bacillus (in: firmicutes)]MBT2636766.1 hypothetical protein [Bacillus sp. ISL-39]MBT2663196.1 hypothetical protein [Bacillus sp. ISL-45]
MYVNKVVFGLLLLTLLLTGCVSEPREIIRVDMRNKENDQYETVKTIMNSDEVTEVKNILNEVKWQDGNWATTRDPAYIIYFFLDQHETEGKQAPSAVYELYVQPNDMMVGILSDSEKYAKLSEEDSQKLMSILTYVDNN